MIKDFHTYNKKDPNIREKIVSLQILLYQYKLGYLSTKQLSDYLHGVANDFLTCAKKGGK